VINTGAIVIHIRYLDGLAIERVVKIQLKFEYILLYVPTLMAWHRSNENVIKIGDKLTS